jgi:RNA-directed DNA polymerase
MRSYDISKDVVLKAFQRVKANKGAAGVDDESLNAFEADLKNNLYKIWSRMCSGSYFPPPVKVVEIPKKSGGKRILGVPTVADRVAQMVAKIYFELKVEPIFHPDSYGYRPEKSAVDALTVTRQRCWRYDWVLEFDIKGLFDNIDHGLLMKAVRKHTSIPWVILYIERWLKAPFQMPDGSIIGRAKGTPQGGVVSPVLANLFLHYAFDTWMVKNHPDKPFARYADDAVAHCYAKQGAEMLLESLKLRMAECKLELHPDKTRIVYCRDSNRRGDYTEASFDFLGYTFRPRMAKNRHGEFFTSFSPAVSDKAKKLMRQNIRGWRIQLKSDKSLEDLSRAFNPVIRGWINYYGRFYQSELHVVLCRLNLALIRWVQRKFKRFRAHKRRAAKWLGRIARQEPTLFKHWEMGIFPAAG